MKNYEDIKPIFIYGSTEIEYLRSKDKRLAGVIDQVGFIERPVIPDIFGALVSSIIGQQISMKAWNTICNRMQEQIGNITASNIVSKTVEDIQSYGMTMRKAQYIKNAAEKVHSGEFDINVLYTMSDDEVRSYLSLFNGIGSWTAEMVMIFSMQRKDVFSFNDIAIHRGLRMLYHHRNIDKKLFDKYRRRYSPYASVASLYLWEIACGACNLKDYAPVK